MNLAICGITSRKKLIGEKGNTQLSKLIDFTSGQVKLVLKTLLKDRTTGQNIIFATDVYENVSFTTEITELMLSNNEKKQRFLLRHGFATK